jgi:hypothetical protein
MLSKCLNSGCSATFHYFGQGRLFRVDFADAGRKHAQAGEEVPACIRSQACHIEYFWLCDECTATMTLELSDAGEVRVVPYEVSAPGPTAVSAPRVHLPRRANAS